MASLPNPPSLIEYEGLRFLIFDTPNDVNLPLYLTEFKKHNVSHVVRVCDPTYQTSLLESNNIKVYDWAFPDGGSPPSDIMHKWRTLIQTTFSEDATAAIGIHCVAGLGRAPVLVAVALIDAGMENLAAVDFIRQKRRGCINATQLHFLKSYRPPAGANGGKCVVM